MNIAFINFQFIAVFVIFDWVLSLCNYVFCLVLGVNADKIVLK